MVTMKNMYPKGYKPYAYILNISWYNKLFEMLAEKLTLSGWVVGPNQKLNGFISSL